LLRESKTFRDYWSAHTVSLLGDQISLLALPLVAVLTLDADAAQMGYLVAFALAPNLLFALHAGAWVDRRGRRRQTMIAADVGRAILLFSVPVAYALDVLTLEQLYGIAFATGALTVLFTVSDASLFVTIVPRERFVEASSLLNGSRAFSYVAGPTVSGFLVQALSAPGALLVDAFSFVGSGALLVRIHPEEPPPDPERGGVMVGLRWVARSAVVRPMLLATATINFFNFVFFALFVLYATRTLGVSPGKLGLVLGAGAIGGLVGAAVATPVTRRFGVGPVLVAGCVLFSAPLLLVPLAAGSDALILACLFAAEFGSAIGVMLLDISGGSIFAAVIPHRLRSRVSGAYTFVNYGVRVLGALAGGLLGSTLGLRQTLWIGAAGAILGVLWLLPSPVWRLRSLPEAAEE
jgi:MFS family permease